MHYSNLVLIEEPSDITEELIHKAVSSQMGERADWWDWWQIGGRWTGLWDGYDPSADPTNIKPCDLCAGTGKRPDAECVNGCNGCNGTGKSQKWPTQWRFRVQDVIPVELVTEEHYSKIHRVVCDEGSFASERYTPWKEDIHEKFPKLEMPPLEWLKERHKGQLAVIVDNHN